MAVTVQIPAEKSAGKVHEVTLGATAADGGTRTSTITVGGETSLPFLHFESEMVHRPVVGVEIHDQNPKDWPDHLREAWGDVMNDPCEWAKAAVAAGADLVVLRLTGTHPDQLNRSPEEGAETVKAVLKAVGVPLIVYGPGVAQRDNEVLLKVAEAAAGERIALGDIENTNYRTIVAAALGSGQIVISQSPIDVNMAKQVNILATDMGLPVDRMLMDPTTGALGYGLEYTYSVMERLRISALSGDAMTQFPMICTVGEESWRQKESKATEGVPDTWGDIRERSIIWEIVTATALLQAGADILVLRHPKSVEQMKVAIDNMMKA
ncbi:MAG TPA: acetyl-CoA decarbonylase/synthase complex subunit delta [Chloroflexota bacterium]